MLKITKICSVLILAYLSACSHNDQQDAVDSSAGHRKSDSSSQNYPSARDEDAGEGTQRALSASTDWQLPLPGIFFRAHNRTAWVMLPGNVNMQQQIPWVWFAHSRRDGNLYQVHKAMFEQFLNAELQ